MWVRIDDGMPEHPKLMETTYPALSLALQVAALCYCNRQLTDGDIPRSKLGVLIPDVPDVAWIDVAAELVAVGIWDTTDKGFHIHDYEKYQPTKEQVEAKREATTKRVAEWRTRNERKCNSVTNITPKPVPKEHSKECSLGVDASEPQAARVPNEYQHGGKLDALLRMFGGTA